MIKNWNPNGNFLFTEEEFNKAKSRDKILPLKCLQCGKIFYKCKHNIQDALNPNIKKQYKYCSNECVIKANTKLIECKCKNCNKIILRTPKSINNSDNIFCSKSCAAKYNNKYSKLGKTNRSKTEKYIEEQLSILQPNLEVEYNSRNILSSGLELDIYIPSKKIAIEINGIYHYKPIYDEKKYLSVKCKDKQKEEECKKLGIKLFVIDISEYKHYNQQYYDEILSKVLEIIKNDLLVK